MPGQHPPIFVIEDDGDLRDGMRLWLEHHGYAVATATDGLEALEVLRAGLRPCLILLDLGLPRINSFGFRRAQLAEPTLADIPVVVVSGTYDARAQCVGLAAAGYMQKPLDPQRLLALAARHRPDPPDAEPLERADAPVAAEGWSRPMRAQRGDAGDVEPSDAAPPSGCVLYVGNNPDDALLSVRALRQARLSTPITVVMDARQALAVLRQTPPQPIAVILLDLTLPDTTGWELLDTIMADRQWREIPVVALTGSSNPADEARCLAHGAVGVVTKPVMPATLTAVLATCPKTRWLVRDEATSGTGK